jgi:CRP/FNR family transcriptional regulator, cyclic AMP receptor protein
MAEDPNMADSDGIEPFLRAAAEEKPEEELLVVPQWQRTDWETLFSYTQRLEVKRANVLIRKDASERALYFVASGLLEVTSVPTSPSLGVIATVHPGSVVGELAFLDGRPRSAKVCAVVDSDLYQLDFEAYQNFAHAHPRETCDLLFAIGRIVALRLRRSQARVAQ